MAEIKKLERRVEPDVVNFLTERLEAAKRGEVSGVLVLSQEAETLDFKTAGLRDRLRIIGFLSHALHKIQTPES